MLMVQAPSLSIVQTLLQTVAALVVPAVATWLAMQFSKLYSRVDKMPDWEKKILVAVYGVVMAGISHAIGVSLPQDLGGLDNAAIQGLLSTGLAFVLHRVFSPKPATP